MRERRLGAAMRAALPSVPDSVRHTIVIEMTRRTLGGAATIMVGIEAVDEHGQSARQFGRVDDDGTTAAPYTMAVRLAVSDNPAERHLSDVLAWMEERAKDVLRRERSTS